MVRGGYLGGLPSTVIRSLVFVFVAAVCVFASAAGTKASVVGVRIGDWAEYGISEYRWESTDPNATMPPDMEGGGPEWFRIEVVAITDTMVTVEMTIHFANGTEQTTRTSGDLATGTGNLTFFLFPAGLGKGDSLPTGVILNETVSRTYAGEVREVNHLGFSYSMFGSTMSYDINFDKATGIMCEISFGSTVTQGEYVTIMAVTEEMRETNMWGRMDIPESSGIVAIWVMLPFVLLRRISGRGTQHGPHTQGPGGTPS